jgi:hypothetical protein
VRTIYPGAQGWDQELLALELQGLIDLKFEVELTGFSLAEIDLVRGCPQRRDCVAGVGDGVSGLVAAVSVPLGGCASD